MVIASKWRAAAILYDHQIDQYRVLFPEVMDLFNSLFCSRSISVLVKLNISNDFYFLGGQINDNNTFLI